MSAFFNSILSATYYENAVRIFHRTTAVSNMGGLLRRRLRCNFQLSSDHSNYVHCKSSYGTSESNNFWFQAMHVTLSLPNYREIETEADAVGLRLAAKACLDVRQAVSFFKRMEMLKKKGLPTGNDEKPSLGEYMSTHPTHEHRWKFMEKQLESAMLLRDECKCEPLRPLPEEVARHMLLGKEPDRTTHNRII